jgi:hypothetical protein
MGESEFGEKKEKKKRNPSNFTGETQQLRTDSVVRVYSVLDTLSIAS